MLADAAQELEDEVVADTLDAEGLGKDVADLGIVDAQLNLALCAKE